MLLSRGRSLPRGHPPTQAHTHIPENCTFFFQSEIYFVPHIIIMIEPQTAFSRNSLLNKIFSLLFLVTWQQGHNRSDIKKKLVNFAVSKKGGLVYPALFFACLHVCLPMAVFEQFSSPTDIHTPPLLYFIHYFVKSNTLMMLYVREYFKSLQF